LLPYGFSSIRVQILSGPLIKDDGIDLADFVAVWFSSGLYFGLISLRYQVPEIIFIRLISGNHRFRQLHKSPLNNNHVRSFPYSFCHTGKSFYRLDDLWMPANKNPNTVFVTVPDFVYGHGLSRLGG
jgi:hypothetical protein